MKYSLPTLLLSSMMVSPTTALFGGTPTSEGLREAYPDLESDRGGNPLILCPFLRMLERSGRLDEVINEDEAVANWRLKRAADDFGCDTLTACGPVIDTVSAGQCITEEFTLGKLNPFRTPQVDLERLWDAPPISHECGFTFENGAGEFGVSAARLASTLAKLASRADDDGHLQYQDILDTKNEICAEEGVTATAPGLVEAQLIFAYLGGVERGFVEYSDVERFLAVDSQMPLTKADEQITALYLLRVN